VRLDALQRAAKGVEYVDVELAADEVAWLIDQRSTHDQRTIVSSHDFEGRPERLYNIVADLDASPADIAKIVWTARTIRDNLEAFEILQHSPEAHHRSLHGRSRFDQPNTGEEIRRVFNFRIARWAPPAPHPARSASPT